jgi:hypothetical protein
LFGAHTPRLFSKSFLGPCQHLGAFDRIHGPEGLFHLTQSIGGPLQAGSGMGLLTRCPGRVAQCHLFRGALLGLKCAAQGLLSATYP